MRSPGPVTQSLPKRPKVLPEPFANAPILRGLFYYKNCLKISPGLSPASALSWRLFQASQCSYTILSYL